MSEMLRGVTWPIDDWDGVKRWLVQSFGALDVANVFEVGPASYIAGSDEDDVPCMQAQALKGHVIWLRLSTNVLELPLLADYKSKGLELDVWRHDELFDDTDGYIFSADLEMLARACVSWFRDRHGMDFSDLGCELTSAQHLPKSASTTE